MRVAHIITRLILGGAQENTILTCQDLMREHNDRVLLITGPPEGPEGSLVNDALARGIPLEVIPALRRAIRPWSDWSAYRAILRVLRDFSPDVVHTHSAKAGILGRRAADKLQVPAIVHTVHGNPFFPGQGRGAARFIAWCECQAARQCHALISVADAMTEVFVAAGIAPREKFSTIYSGMEVEPLLAAHDLRGSVRAELGFADDDVVIAKVARLFHLKGHADLIAAAPQVVEACPQARFLLVGDGILRTSLEQQIAAAGLTGRFHFTGLVPPERIPGLLAAADLVVHASLREGLARVLPQALIVGRPVVSYDIDGAREVVLPEETGLLVPPRDIQALAAALIRLATDPPLRERWGQAGRQRFADVFRHTRMTEDIRQLYERLLEAGT